MIRSLFLPEKIGSYYLLKKKIVGIEITQHFVKATCMILSGRSRSIQAIFEEVLVRGQEQEIIQALSTLKKKIGSYDELRLTLPSSLTVFKELTLPFIGRKKVKMVVPLEVEGMLPFSIDQGVIDSIVTYEDLEDKKTELFIAAIKNSVLDQFKEYFNKAGLTLTSASVDIIDLYGLYMQNASSEASKKSYALLHIDAKTATLALVISGKLRYVRNFSRGLYRATEEPKKDRTLDATIKKELEALAQEVQLTIDITVPKISSEESLSKILLCGAVTDFKGTKELLSQQFPLPVERFTPHKLISSGFFTSQVDTVPGSSLVSIATATVPENTYDFTLLWSVNYQKSSRLMSQQLIATALLVGTLFLSFTIYSFVKMRTYKNAYRQVEKEALTALGKHFRLRGGAASSLELANKAAQRELKKQETAWMRISPDRRYAYLTYLAELTKCIDMKESQLKLDSIIIKDDTVKLYGSVPGFPQLNKLQNQLDCPLFKRVPKLQDKNFKIEPITLFVDQEQL